MQFGTLRQFQELGGDLLALWLEASCVVGLRTLRIIEGGPKALTEARLMIDEKVIAQQRLAAAIAAGRHGRDALAITRGTTRFFLDGVRANRRRLTRS